MANSCTEYNYYIVKITSYDGPIRCDNCPLMQTYSRKYCQRTGELIADSRNPGFICPLIKITKEQWYELEKLRNEELENEDDGEYVYI